MFLLAKTKYYTIHNILFEHTTIVVMATLCVTSTHIRPRPPHTSLRTGPQAHPCRRDCALRLRDGRAGESEGRWHERLGVRVCPPGRGHQLIHCLPPAGISPLFSVCSLRPHTLTAKMPSASCPLRAAGARTSLEL